MKKIYTIKIVDKYNNTIFTLREPKKQLLKWINNIEKYLTSQTIQFLIFNQCMLKPKFRFSPGVYFDCKYETKETILNLIKQFNTEILPLAQLLCL